MKLYVHYEEAGQDEKALTLKLTLPKSWAEQPLLQVLELFIESYNKKKTGLPPLDKDFVHMEKAGGVILPVGNIVSDMLSDRDDLYVRSGPGPASGKIAHLSSPPNAHASSESSTGLLRCKNYGCNQSFSEENNSEEACRFHKAPPVFHDTKKGWSCCAKRVYDWDEFHTIEGCTTGRHSLIDPKEIFAPSPTLAAAAQAERGDCSNTSSAATVIKSIDEFNQSNPNAAAACKTAASMTQAGTRCTVKPDGSATCLNKGCQKDYLLKENHPSACRYHAAGPVFHDAGKYWSCCPGTVKYDFDDFLKIPGCMLSSHYDGSQESLEAFTRHAKTSEGT